MESTSGMTRGDSRDATEAAISKPLVVGNAVPRFRNLGVSGTHLHVPMGSEAMD